jgi:hypothetical protein
MSYELRVTSYEQRWVLVLFHDFALASAKPKKESENVKKKEREKKRRCQA